MAERGPTSGAPLPEGLAGGPGPTPPGFDDGTPRPLEGAGGRSQPAAPEPEGSGRREEPERAPLLRGDPEEPDPS